MTQAECIEKLSPALFWDIDKDKADMETCPPQIIQRVLEYGSLDDWKIVQAYYGLDRIVAYCKQMRSLDPVALAFICCISHTKEEEYRCYRFRQSNPTHWNS